MPDFATRVLVHAPSGKDARLASKVLAGAGIATLICADVPNLLAEIERGAGAVITVEEALRGGGFALLAQYVAKQPTWSDIPILLMTMRGAASSELDRAIAQLGNLTLLERPVRSASLISAVRSALRARLRQYQVNEAERRKDEFLATLAHELRNPLAPIQTGLDIMRLAEGNLAASINAREMMERQLRNMVRLVDDLLDISRISREQVELKNERVSLQSIVTTAIETSQPLIQAGKHQLTVHMAAPSLELDVDPTRIAQVLSNLVNNSAKYTPDRGRIDIFVDQEGSEAVISVVDTGAGIPPESLSSVFEMFVQIDGNRGRAQGGLGIGLTLARNLVELHGGTLTAASGGRDKGSTFSIRLPLADTPGQKPSNDMAIGMATDKVQRRWRILIVDDNVDAAQSMKLLCDVAGHSTQVANDGSSALTVAKEFKPDAVFLDIGMPVMNGYDVARAFRCNENLKKAALIAVTGWGDLNSRARSKEAGFDAHLTKPTNFGSLEEVLSKILH